MPHLGRRVEVHRKVRFEGQVLCVLVKITLHDAGYPPIQHMNQSPLVKMTIQNTRQKGSHVCHRDLPCVGFSKGSFLLRSTEGRAHGSHQGIVARVIKMRHSFCDIFVPALRCNQQLARGVAMSLPYELLELQSKVQLKARLSQGYQQLSLQKEVPELYPGVWDMVKKLLICLLSSSLVEQVFSIVTDLVTKKRSQLQVVRRGDLRLRVTSIEPNINRLVQSHLRELSSSH
ncbi:hypothetical protein TTRE_0000124401 [Trichuris trichiura]|uniref:Uncharacterized protein n=1 Tax=Trichuris trichiura TaxID=36087 RepID=A0A077YYT3_TRITR|nr:hypothetical protein TTRE_0000124401 [Trichuris trichiura]